MGPMRRDTAASIVPAWLTYSSMEAASETPTQATVPSTTPTVTTNTMTAAPPRGRRGNRWVSAEANGSIRKATSQARKKMTTMSRKYWIAARIRSTRTRTAIAVTVGSSVPSARRSEAESLMSMSPSPQGPVARWTSVRGDASRTHPATAEHGHIGSGRAVPGRVDSPRATASVLERPLSAALPPHPPTASPWRHGCALARWTSSSARTISSASEDPLRRRADARPTRLDPAVGPAGDRQDKPGSTPRGRGRRANSPRCRRS